MSEQRYEVVAVCTGQVCVYDRLKDEGFVWFSDGCDDWREKAATCAAALNAAEQAGKERELLAKAAMLLAGKATGSICIVEDEFGDEYDAPGCWWCGSLHGASHSAACEYAAWLAEYAALNGGTK